MPLAPIATSQIDAGSCTHSTTRLYHLAEGRRRNAEAVRDAAQGPQHARAQLASNLAQRRADHHGGEEVNGNEGVQGIGALCKRHVKMMKNRECLNGPRPAGSLELMLLSLP